MLLQEPFWCSRQLHQSVLDRLHEMLPPQAAFTQVLDLLCSMLQYDPDVRPTAEDLLQHEFFASSLGST